MWFYLRTFFYLYLVIFNPASSTNSQQSFVISDNIDQVTDYTIDDSIQHRLDTNLFQATSFLNPGYGILFEHVGQLHQSVYRHYLVVGLKLPTLHNIPNEPEKWHQACESTKPQYPSRWLPNTFQKVFHEDYCAKGRFQRLYTEIAEILHSDVPAMLPNQVVPYATMDFFNKTPQSLPWNHYHPEYTENEHNRSPRSVTEMDETNQLLSKIPPLELDRARDYLAKYGEPIPLDADTIYAEDPPRNVTVRSKWFLGTLVHAVSKLFRCGNVFW